MLWVMAVVCYSTYMSKKTLMRVRARDVQIGDQYAIQGPGCSPQVVGEVITAPEVIQGVKVTFRVKYSATQSGMPVHWANTKVWVQR